MKVIKGRNKYPSCKIFIKENIKRRLRNIKSYRDFKRKKVCLKYDTVDWDTKLRYIDPSDIKVMQMSCRQTDDDFRYLYNRVPMHKVEKGRFTPYYYHGIILDGKWDKYRKDHNFDRVYKGLKQHYKNNKDFYNTEYISQYILREETYEEKGYTEQKIKIIEELYNSLKNNGFIKNYELDDDQKRPVYNRRKVPVTVNIDREGNYIFNNTAHNRLGISKILELDEIPVLVVVRHKQSKNIKI